MADTTLEMMKSETIKEGYEMQSLSFGKSIYILLITDHLTGCAKNLQEYLNNNTDITADLVNNLDDTTKKAYLKCVDFLIIVGMLYNDENYKSIQAVKKTNSCAYVIMYASLDSVIRDICREQNIKYTYNRYHCMEDFVTYMRLIHSQYY